MRMVYGARAGMRLVIIESPYAGNVERNLRYLRCCMADCLERGEAPFASHGLYTQDGVLDDLLPEERAKGMAAGFAWRAMAEATVVYRDLSYSKGMLDGIENAHKLVNFSAADPMWRLGHGIEYRELGEKWTQVEAFNAALEAW
jgi:hypothetical protein